MSRQGQRQGSEVNKDSGYALRSAGLQAGLHNKADSWLLRRVIGRVLLTGRACSSILSGASDRALWSDGVALLVSGATGYAPQLNRVLAMLSAWERL